MQIGDDCIIRENTVIGSDGLTTRRNEEGKIITIPQSGGVVIENDVQIGANSVICKGAIDNTIIGSGSRIDNCSFISHNVKIGRNTIIVGEVLMMGSSSTGERAYLSGNAVVRDGVSVGNDAFVGMGSDLKRNMVSTSFQKERPYKELVEVIEAAAVSKILNLDDHGIKDNNHYPYDLVHYKDSRKYVVTVPKIVRKEENNVPICIGIHKNKELEQIIPPRFHELVNQIIIDYEELGDKEIWTKYGLKDIWFTVEAFTKEKQQAPLLGTIIINQLVDREYVLQLDWKDDIEDYVDNIADFWEGKELKLINFDLRNDQYYYAQIPKNSTLKFIYEVSITEGDC